ncbi:MAG: hypothetical protein M1833_002726 [Piccolia ochrophora]|nr:MAG: hypothetical protein M1833_002726 [Piccolia ochrophora]
MAANAAARPESRLTPTPPAQPLSKRDKRRTALSDKLNDLSTSFTNNRDLHYRQQLQSLQVDMNLVMRADPYEDGPLNDMGEDIAEMVNAATGGAPQGGLNGVAGGQAGQRRLEFESAALAGRWHSRFVEVTNNSVEDRDGTLTALHGKYEDTCRNLVSTNYYRARMAHEEHRALSGTIRERLIQSVSSKRVRLQREKEQLDIADSNALLLHPSQFSITNPSSPGGAQSNRKTRNTRHRPGEVEEISTSLAAVDGSLKRKRKNAIDDNETGSPAPASRNTDTGAASPYRDAKGRSGLSQAEPPLYSVDKLFTEKELSMHLNTAAVAAAHYFIKAKAQPRENGTTIDFNPPAPASETGNGTSLTNGERPLPFPRSSLAPESQTGLAVTAADGDDDSTPAAPEMDRTGSTNRSHHATRSTRNGLSGANTTSALSILGDIAASSSERPSILPAGPIPFVAPPLHPNKTGTAPPPPPLRPEEQDDDILRLNELLARGPGVTDLRLLEGILPRAPGESPLPSLVDARATSLLPTVVTRLSSTTNPLAVGDGGAGGVGVGAVPMSAQSSTAGVSDVAVGAGAGGVPMSRGDSAVGMKRSASGAGLGNGVGSGGEKRVRNR